MNRPAKLAPQAAADIEDDLIDYSADNVEVIPAKLDLKKKVRERRAVPGELDPVAAAEAALARMSKSFAGWMANESETLVAAWAVCRKDDGAPAARDVLYRAGHDIKGQAATLGFPLAGEVAASLCALMDSTPADAKLPGPLVDQHVKAIRAIVLENARDGGSPLARAMVDSLRDVTESLVEARARRA